MPYSYGESSVEATASWYESGELTANGEAFNPDANTCASNSYKFGTILKVTNLANGRSVYCRVNDTGGFHKYGRAFDLSRKTFSDIADLDKGLIQVRIEAK